MSTTATTHRPILPSSQRVSSAAVHKRTLLSPSARASSSTYMAASSLAPTSITLPAPDDFCPNFGRDLLPAQDLLPHAPQTDTDNLVIAPWLATPEEDAQPPTPPPKPRTFGFSNKSSLSSFTLPRQSSNSNISLSGSRSSQTVSTHSMSSNPDFSSSHEPRKSKGIFPDIFKKRSRSRMRSDVPPSDEVVPPLPTSHSFSTASTSTALSGASSSSQPSIKNKFRRPKPYNLSSDSSRPKAEHEHQFMLDTDLGKMDGIVDPSVMSSAPDSGSPLSGHFDRSSSDLSSMNYPIAAPSPNIFSNPFSPSSSHSLTPVPSKFDSRKISPTTRPQEIVADDSPMWTAPESWAVDKEGEDASVSAIAEEESSSDDNEASSASRPRPERRRTAAASMGGKSSQSSVVYQIRIYRANGTYHVVKIDLSVTVEQLTFTLNKKLLLNPEREPYSLYLKERGRERVLAPTERPANVVRRRLEQAGYEQKDGLDMLGAGDLAFLMRLVYKSNVLGPASDELHIDTFENINLTGRSLRTVPILLYPHADAIVSLNLSRNPMLEIPLDFIQACTSLHELRLTNMAMKKVPQSVRHCRTLHRLDLSCNRIADLDDAGLDRIPELWSLKMQNNRMEKLPWWFPRLRALKDLNISNNKFRVLPSVISDIPSLVDLDVSFNTIDKLPDNIGQLRELEQLIIIGNRVSEFPASCCELINLRMLDCRRNHISELSKVSMLPKVEQIFADHNAMHALDISFGPSVKQLDASHNDITQLALAPGPLDQPFALTSLDISHAKLSALDERALAQLTALEVLRIDHNSIRYIPDSLGSLSQLIHLSCSNNQLRALPNTIGQLQKLEMLEAHNNSLSELPGTLWNCASLQLINVTSNLLGSWGLPPIHGTVTPAVVANSASSEKLAVGPAGSGSFSERKASTGGSVSGRTPPPLVFSLERLYLGENRLTDDTLHPLALLQELRVLNLSFNDIQDIPPSFFRNLAQLRELYLSGNRLSTIPTEDLHRLTKLGVLFLNGNKLQTLPHELGKLMSLTVLDVGSNILKYNIFNWEYDWNWNFNTSLQYLNLSGNKRLEIRTDMAPVKEDEKRKVLADFSGLTQLRVLGLMDITATNGASIPDENEDRRVRTSLSEVNGMAYGIADTLDRATEHLNMLDLVQPQFRGKCDEAVFAMFGRASHIGNNHWLNSYLQSNFVQVYQKELSRLTPDGDEAIPDALRRAFLLLNRHLHDYLYSNASTRKMSHVSTSTSNAVRRDMANMRSGASGVVLHLVKTTLYVANAGRSLAVVSRQGNAKLLSKLHDPFDREETTRIRNAEGWVSPKGCVNDEIDVARSFGFYNLLPVVNPKPYVDTYELNEQDEFVIVGNSGLWDHVSYQTAVDIARTERGDPMIAAQKLRDLAISHHGLADGLADGTTMIMVISVADLFRGASRSRQPTMESVMDTETNLLLKRRKRDKLITNIDISRLDGEVPAPTGHVTLVFTDIRNSTHLWEVNAGMPTAMVLHNNLLRRQLRFCGGYEVKTEGDAFMCSFPSALAAIWWCLSVQVQLLQVEWPLEILECEDGKEVYGADGKVLVRGLSVRMGLHSGLPVCEPDPITNRMDYFGPMVNRASRISGCAAGGQIMCSADIVREINALVLKTEGETEQSILQPAQAIDAIKSLGIVVVPVGEVKLKGLEVPEMLSLVYSEELAGRQGLNPGPTDPSPSTSRVQFSVEQMRELALLCIRLEALSAGRVCRPNSTASRSPSQPADEPADVAFSHCKPQTLLPAMDKASDADLMYLLDSLATRIDNALTRLSLNRLTMVKDRNATVDLDWLQQLISIIRP